MQNQELLQGLFLTGDPITKFFRLKLNLRPLLSSIVLVSILLLPILILAFIFNYWQDSAERIGLMNDYEAWFYIFISIPAMFFYFFWLPMGINNVIQGLIDNKTLIIPTDSEEHKDRFHQFILGFDKAYSRSIWAITSITLVTVYIILITAPELKTYQTWLNSEPIVYQYVLLFWILVFSIGLLFIIRVIISIVWLNNLLQEFPVDVRILHPDGAGGLSPLGEFSVKLGYLIGILGVTVVASTILSSYSMTGTFSGPIFTLNIIILTIVYFVMAPVAFFAPINSAHGVMKKAKYDFLLDISNQFESERERVQSLRTEDIKKYEDSFDKIFLLQKTFQFGRHFPVWPFNTDSLLRFFAAVTSPLVLAAVTTIINIVIK